MSSADSMLIFGICGFIILLPILAVGGVFFVKQLQKANSRAVIKMDGANCVHTLAGNVEIRPAKITSIIALVFLAAAGIATTIGALLSLINLNIQGIVMLGGASILIVFAVNSLIRALRKPGSHFKADTKVLEIGRGSSQRVIPFSDIDHVLVGTAEGRTQKKLSGGVVGIRLKTNEAIQLGTLSGSKDTFDRARTIGQIIADVTGTSVQSQHRPRE